MIASDFANLARSVSGRSNTDKDNIVKRINCDANDLGFKHFTKEEIVREKVWFWPRAMKMMREKGCRRK